MTNNDSYHPSDIERIVMRRVYRAHILHTVFSGGTLAALVCIAALWGIGREVWVAMVFQNGPQDFFGHLGYLIYAFAHTRLIVQALTLLTATSLVYLARATAQFLSRYLIPQQVSL